MQCCPHPGGSAASRPRPKYAEDLDSPAHHRLGSWTVTAEEIVAFGREWDPLPIHTDAHAAAESHFGGLVASGIHTFGIFQRIAVHELYGGWAVIAGRAIREMLLPKPVRPDTTLAAGVHVDRVRLRDNATAVAYLRGQLHDAGGDLVFEVQLEMVMARRPD